MKRFFPLVAALVLICCCTPQAKDTPDDGNTSGDEKKSLYYVNLFSYNNMNSFYLWRDQITDGLQSWTVDEEPIAKVASLRYKEGEQLVDRWTELMEDYTPFQSNVTGNGKSFGMDFVLLRVQNSDNVVMEITFTYADSPARQAGLKRGDIVMTVDGQTITMSNYTALLNEKIYNQPGTIALGMEDGRSVSMTAVKMYANPVHLARTLETGHTKVGYLHFTGFTLDACTDLVEAFRQFKADGIRELVLDLRYNTGGYATTAQVLGSLIAPHDIVKSGAVFNKEVFNSNLAEEMDGETCFSESTDVTLSGGKTTLNMLEANPGIERLWVLVTGHTASASESLVCGLMPYMDVRLVGSQTYGKFCGGYLITAENWYKLLEKDDTDINCKEALQYTKTWGLYVIASRYTDCKGETRSMPSGIPVQYEAYDEPLDGFELGNPSESMLSVVLGNIGGEVFAKPVKSTRERAEVPFEKPGDGVLLH